jgi:hypothetical protein
VAEQRTKEIGVRKVLGASVFLWKMLSKDFVALVIISMAIVTCIHYFMHRWLQNYHIEQKYPVGICPGRYLRNHHNNRYSQFQSIKAAMEIQNSLKDN